MQENKTSIKLAEMDMIIGIRSTDVHECIAKANEHMSKSNSES